VDTKCIQQGLSSPSDFGANIPHRSSSSILFKILSSPSDFKYSEKGLFFPVYNKWLPQELALILKKKNVALTRTNIGFKLQNIKLRNESKKLRASNMFDASKKYYH